MNIEKGKSLIFLFFFVLLDLLIKFNMQYKTHHYNHKKISEAILSRHGFHFSDNFMETYHFEPKKPKFLNELWDESCFNEINLPEELFPLSQDEIGFFNKKIDMRVLDLPIKFPGTGYRVPIEMIDFLMLIKKVAFNEKRVNEKLDDYYCYLTVDRRLVKKGNNTRKGGIHVDGFQGARLKELLPIDHSYIAYSSEPTIFYNQKFKVMNNWDKNCHNFFNGFEAQIKEDSAITYPCHNMLVINAYTLHQAPIVEEDVYRTFFRMSYSVREFDRLGNAHNPLFNYNWKMVPRDTQENLICPV